MLRYGDLVRCARPAGVEVGGAVASSERAAAAVAGGGGGPGGGGWRGAGRRPGGGGGGGTPPPPGVCGGGGGGGAPPRRRRARGGGGGRRGEELDAGLVRALLALVEPDERGDPESPLRWTTKSLRHLAAELARQGHPVSAPTAGRLLRAAGFSLQANAKTLEGAQ